MKKIPTCLVALLILCFSSSLYSEEPPKKDVTPPGRELNVQPDKHESEETKEDWDVTEQKKKKPYVDKGDMRIGVFGSIDTGKYAGFFLQAVSQFTIEAEYEYYVHKRLAPITRFSSTILFTDQDNITAFAWGAGIKGVYNFDKRFLPYIKVIPEIYFYNLEIFNAAKDKTINFALLLGVGMDVLLTRNVAVGFVFHYEVIFSDKNYVAYSFPFGFSFYF